MFYGHVWLASHRCVFLGNHFLRRSPFFCYFTGYFIGKEAYFLYDYLLSFFKNPRTHKFWNIEFSHIILQYRLMDKSEQNENGNSDDGSIEHSLFVSLEFGKVYLAWDRSLI